MKKLFLGILLALFLPIFGLAQLPQNNCYDKTLSATGRVLLFGNSVGTPILLRAGYYTTGSPGGVTIALEGGTTLAANLSPTSLLSATNTTGLDMGKVVEQYRYWYVNLSTLSGGSSPTVVFTYCVTRDATVEVTTVALGAGTVITTSLTTNAVDIANSVTGASNAVVFEGSSADANETTVTATNPTADRTVTLADATGTVFLSTLGANAPEIVNSIWGASNAFVFEGGTADGFELSLAPTDVGADVTATIPGGADAAFAFFPSTLTTNDVDAANSIWAITGSALVAEGATADASETTLDFTDPTADITVRFRTDLVDTYHILTAPDADLTAGIFVYPPNAAADANLATNVTDNMMVVYRVYIPMWITVANIYARGDVITDSGSDDLLGVAVYEDADAGTNLGEATSADLSADANVTFNVTDFTIGPGMYRIGVCSGDISGVAFVAETTDDEFIDIVNVGAVAIGSAANPCVLANPPATTGALSTVDVNMVVLKFGP